MAEIATKPRRVTAIGTVRRPRIVPGVRLASVVDRTAELSEDVLKSLEAGERAAVEALGKFLIAIEEAVPREVAGSSDVAKQLTEAGVEMVDRLIQAQNELLRSVVESAARAMRARERVEGDGAE